MSTRVVMERVGVSRDTVSKWRRRFLADRLDGLADEPRPGRPRTVMDEQVADLIARTLESKPENATHSPPSPGRRRPSSRSRNVIVTPSWLYKVWITFFSLGTLLLGLALCALCVYMVADPA
ncbi:helix-turn-helix domain-containing protein [Streptomyces sp. NPDC059352]|uniref:helix-turn-helix domain-containing protein n=1 Tax=Streptomyces sp. NPDC059352 TaxID=3346810 RepID=UPI00368423B5